MPSISPEKTSDTANKTNSSFSPTKRFSIAQREPWNLPDCEIEVPAPKQVSGPPPTINLLTTLLPPALMAIGMVIVPLVMGTAKGAALIPMALVGIGGPLASLISFNSQKKKYQNNLIERERGYKKTLDQEKAKIQKLCEEQRETLEREYPTLGELERIAADGTKRLWWRRPMDNDFLSLRIGSGEGVASFKVSAPRYSDANEPLLQSALELVQSSQNNPRIPLLLNLGKVGSVAISANTSAAGYDLARRLTLDILVHHSPQDVQLAIFANTRDAENRWSWLRWAPHTAALNSGEKPRRVIFTAEHFDQYLKWLSDEYQSRLRQVSGFGGSGKKITTRSAIVLLLDDDGLARQTPEIGQIALGGVDVGIFLIFIGGQNWPRECRSKLTISGASDFTYVETWDSSGKAIKFSGKIEPTTIEVCDHVSRSLSGLEVMGTSGIAQLPENIRLSAVLGSDSLDTVNIQKAWSRIFNAEDLLQFPIGVTTNRDQLEKIEINLLPENKGGVDAYHTILIGTTGSGKSEFMKSMVMGAALRYPPDQLNFFFLDFKGGAAFSVFEQLPHVSGIVTNLKPELVDRGLESIRSEIDRRQSRFSIAQVQNIWTYNQQNPDSKIPHLVLLLDEFARGLADFPKLRETLDLLVRLGRSLGMYLILANQDSNAEVDKLLNNVGWRIALKVGKDEEISMIDRALMNESGKIPRRAGEGYLRSIKAVISHFQAGYAGVPVVTTSNQDHEEFTIFRVEPDGNLTKFFRSKSQTSKEENLIRPPSITEEEKIIENIKIATRELNIKPVPRIYLDPLPDNIDLVDIINDSNSKVKFVDHDWTSDTVSFGNLVTPIGVFDSPTDCLQDTLNVDFGQQDGHLWIVGAPGSGKAMTLTSIILSLALTHIPAELHIYILEFGAGTLKNLEMLPHVGAVIRLQEKERIQRLLTFLDKEMERRTAHDTQVERAHLNPDLFVIINNYAEMRATYPDEADRISRYVRDGKSAGIHLIITTNRGAELNRAIASNLARKLVLQLASKDEYMDVVGRMVAPISVRSEGRGYWITDRVFECQVASPKALVVKTIAREMEERWKGSKPLPIGTIPNCISLSTLWGYVSGEKDHQWNHLPLGIAFDDLNVHTADLSRELSQWLVIGPRESGKSNFLACTVKTLLELGEGKWEVFAFSLRRSLLSELKFDSPNFHFSNSLEATAELLNGFTEKIQNCIPDQEKRFMLIIDDLGAIYESGREIIPGAINTLLPILSGKENVHVMAAGLIDELRNQVGTTFIKNLKQSRTGMVFSKDASDLDWLGAALPLEFRKLEMPVGRGFFVSKGKLTYLQTPFLKQCQGKDKPGG